MRSSLKKLLIAYIVSILILEILFSLKIFANVDVEQVEDDKRSITIKVKSDKKITKVCLYKKIKSGQYILFYKSIPDKSELECVIPENKLSTEEQTYFKIVVEEEDGTRNYGDITAEKLTPYPSMNPEETAKPSWSPSTLPTKPTPSPSPSQSTAPSASEAPSTSPESSTEPSTETSPEASTNPSTEASTSPSESTSPSGSTVDPGTKLNATQAGQVIANCAKYLSTERKSEFVYGGPLYSEPRRNREKAYKGIKVDGHLYGTSGHYPGKQSVSFKNKYQMDCAGFCNLVVHWSTNLGGKSYTNFFGDNGFKKISKSKLGMGSTISKAKAKEVFKPGDIVHWSGHYAIYIGNGKIAEMVNYGKPSLSNWTLHVRDVSVWNGHHEFECIYRITEEAAKSIDVSKIDSNYLQGI